MVRNTGREVIAVSSGPTVLAGAEAMTGISFHARAGIQAIIACAGSSSMVLDGKRCTRGIIVNPLRVRCNVNAATQRENGKMLINRVDLVKQLKTKGDAYQQ